MNDATAPDHAPARDRYDARAAGWFRRAGRSGLKLPAVSLGLWHNFGDPGVASARFDDEPSMHANARAIVLRAFDLGVTHFDLANAYGPPPGSAESRFGRILKADLAAHRDELVISTKAGFGMWPGPYGDLGSRKYLLASLDQSLKRLGVEYVDVYYHHRPDPDTPLEETLGALDHAVRSGKAIYAAVSNYAADLTRRAVGVAARDGLARPVLHQPSYSLLDRWVERGAGGRGGSLLDVCGDEGVGVIPYSPLAQGRLTDRYLDGVPADSRAAGPSRFLAADGVTAEVVGKARALREVARDRGQTLAQLALAWVLRDARVTSALIGASRPEQVADCCGCLDAGPLDAETLGRIEAIIG